MIELFEKDGIFVGKNGAVSIREDVFENFLKKSGYNINDESGEDVVDSTKVFDIAFDLGFLPLSDEEDGIYRFLMNPYELYNLQEADPKLYDLVNTSMLDYVNFKD